MSVSHGYSTLVGIEYGGCGEDKKKEIVSHQLGVSMGYGDAHCGSPGLGGPQASGLLMWARLMGCQDTRQKTSSRVQMGLSFACKASLAIRI